MLFRAIFVALALACAPYAQARAECLAAPPPDAPGLNASEVAGGPSQQDFRGRIVAPVYVNGQGPFRFIVDTGANRSVLSPRLVERLGLTARGESAVHTIHGETQAPLVAVQSLRYGELALPSDELPMMGGGVLAGEHGLLGVDGLRERRLRIDFESSCIEILPSRAAGPLRGWVRLDGEIRFGHLLLVRGAIRGLRVNILIDTGSDTSLANTALAEALRTRMRAPILGAEEFNRAYTAGQPIVLDRAMIIPQLNLNELEIGNLVAFVGDFHIFQLWNLQDEPTLLIGMDVIARTRAIAIDYGRSAVYFRIDESRRRNR